jgi:hypothetical protein
VIELASPLPSGWEHDEWIFLVGAAMGPVLYVDETISWFRRYARALPAEYPRDARSADSAGWVSETTKWQNLLSRLKYAGPMLPYADRVLHDVSVQIRALAFQASLRNQRAPIRAARKLPWVLTGRNPTPNP